MIGAWIAIVVLFFITVFNLFLLLLIGRAFVVVDRQQRKLSKSRDQDDIKKFFKVSEQSIQVIAENQILLAAEINRLSKNIEIKDELH